MSFNKVFHCAESENILDSEIGLVTKTGLGRKAMATDVDGRSIIKAGSLFADAEDEYTAVDSPDEDTYTRVTPGGSENPSEKGWYVWDSSDSEYVLTEDTTVVSGHEYFTLSRGDNPKAKGWYTKNGNSYELTTDTSVDSEKTYYELTHEASGLVGVVFLDYDMTDYEEYPIAVVTAGHLKYSKVSSEVQSMSQQLATFGIHLHIDNMSA